MAVTYGSTDFASSGNVTLTSIAAVNDPQGAGPGWEYTYSGTESGINALAAALFAAGIRYRTTTAGGDFGLISTYTHTDKDGDANAEVAKDTYGFDTEGINVSIFAHPLATAEALAVEAIPRITYDIDNGFVRATENPQSLGGVYRQTIEESRDDPDIPLGLDSATYPFATVILSHLRMGQEYFELRRPILRRTRTFSARYATRLSVDVRQPAWTTTALISEFSLPSDITSRLPANPSTEDTPAGTAWVWRLTVDTSEYSASLRSWVETRQWVFEAVSPFFYNIL